MSTQKTKTLSAHYVSNPFRVIFQGFSELFKHNQTPAIIILVFSALGVVFNVADVPFQSSAPQQTASGTNENTVALILLIVGVIFIVLLPIIIFFVVMFNGFVSLVALKTSQKQTIDFADAIKTVFNKFWTLLWIHIIVGLKVIGGLLLLIIPGIRAIVRYNMVLIPVFEQGASAKQAIAYTKKISRGHLIEIFGMAFAASLIPFLSSVMEAGGKSVMYPQLTHLDRAGERGPKAHWLNYLFFYLIAGILLLVVLIVALISAFAQ